MHIRRSDVSILVLVLSVASAVFPLFGQEGSAALNGRVTDPGGLAIVAAKLQAVNVNTSATYASESNEAGLYTFPTLSL